MQSFKHHHSVIRFVSLLASLRAMWSAHLQFASFIIPMISLTLGLLTISLFLALSSYSIYSFLLGKLGCHEFKFQIFCCWPCLSFIGHCRWQTLIINWPIPWLLTLYCLGFGSTLNAIIYISVICFFTVVALYPDLIHRKIIISFVTLYKRKSNILCMSKICNQSKQHLFSNIAYISQISEIILCAE